MNTAVPTRRRWLWLALFVGLFTFLALLSSVQSYVSQLVFDKPVPWSLAFRRSFKDWYTCGVLSLGVLWFCRRNRLEPGRVGRWVAAHFVGAGVYFALDIIASAWLLAGETSVQTGEVLTFSYLARKLALHYIIMCLMMYWFVVFAHQGWHYYKRYRERELHASQLQRELVEARLDALRMQLNPHFLFNTLHAVSSLIHDNPEGADRVLARLSELLRLSLDQTKPQEVPLSEELTFLDTYLEIEKTRFAERLTVEKQVEAGTEQALVPYLILQPLVENAIRHGIEQREEAGHVAIRARRDNGTLHLRVSDSGSGRPLQHGAPFREGIGLSNTRSRLHHLYGDDYRLDLVPSEGGGLEARIDIPYRTNPAQLDG
jgi:signal transduction histidine kinase